MKTLSKILVTALILLSALSCRKLKQHKPIIVNFEVINPVTKKGYENVKWTVLQSDSKNAGFFNPAKQTVFMEGFTDASGKSRIEFKRPMSKKLHYRLEIGIPPISIAGAVANQNSWQLKNKTEQDITAYVTESKNIILHFKNINCFDNNDNFVIDIPVYEGKYYKSLFSNSILYSYTETHSFTGCADEYISTGFYTDIYPYTISVTRNGVTETINKTLEITPDSDTINIFY